MSNYQPSFFVVPARIMNLPGLTIQLLKFYEKIFHFWHSGYECFVGNKVLMEYSGMKSMSSVADAFQYFEGHGEMERKLENGRRYIKPPLREIEIENHGQDEKLSTEGLATARGGSRYSEGGGLATARHNNNKYNNTNLKKSFCKKDQKKNSYENEKRHLFAESMDAMASEERHIKKNDELKRTQIPETFRKMHVIKIKNEIENENKSTVPWFNDNH